MVIEAHNLIVGQHFGWNDRDDCTVTETGIIDRVGVCLFLYRDRQSHIHGHPFDHTPVFVQ